ncbi:MogA/MoaB family molybdenum cofactor biosynthesis protein [Niallia sp. 01092]|uniref:MogA/MoaB family molybdenum cofactor biosynthesis protein n=1 Tax=unclassified Niallia TaxID=2837522 RepID=UPI003FD0032F
MSQNKHIKQEYEVINCKVITVSDTRTVDTDTSGKLMRELLQEKNHFVSEHIIIKDDMNEIRKEVILGVQSQEIDAVLLNGGTGISPRDVTIEALKPLFIKELNGFGELFRMLSYTEDIGSAAILSRAIAGTIHNKVVFATPGSTGAVRLAMKKLILPELSHIVSELQKI